MKSLELDVAVADYRLMRLIRRFEERSTELLREGLIVGSMHLCSGQEAVPVGAVSSLGDDDALVATYRGHGWALARGVPPAAMFAELMGRDSSLCGGRGGSAYFSSSEHGFLGENSIVGAGVPIALGAALAAKRSGGSVAMVSIGDGALNQGATHEALNFAAVWTLPLVTVVESNGYAELTPTDAMFRLDSLADRARAYGMPGVEVAGRDPGRVREAVDEAVGRARDGGGPGLVVALCDRLSGHYSGDVQHYRPKGEVEEALLREPLVAMRERLDDAGGALAEADAAVEAELDRAIEEAMAIEPADPATVGEHLYA